MAIRIPPDYVELAGQLADLARPIARRRFRQPLAVVDKPDRSPATVADLEIEAAMRERLQARVPDHGVYGEEYGQRDADRDWVWALDPIDGTRSFIAGVPLFGVLIALCHQGEPVYGVVEQPIQRERWQGGHGHPTRRNGQPARTRPCRLADAYQFTTSPDQFKTPADIAAFRRVAAQVSTVRFGADCYAAGLIASGHAHLMVEASLEPYDYMALAPVIEAAGGRATDWSGAPLSFHGDGRFLAAADAELHAQALALLRA